MRDSNPGPLAIAVFCAVALSACAAGFPVAIQLQERAGVARSDEPVIGGIPFPRGLVKDAAELALTDAAGKPVPAQFDVLNKWPEDGSTRWVLLTTKASVTANAKQDIRIVRARTVNVKGALKVSRGGDRIVVDTGKVRFAVKTGAGFNVIDEAVAGSRKVVEPSARGLYMDMDGDLFSTVYDLDPKVEVESEGPQSVAIKAEGQMATRNGAKGFHYLVRIHACADSDRLRVVPTVMRLYGSRNDKSNVRDFGLEIALPAECAGQFAIGTETGAATGTLAPGQDATLKYTSSDSYTLSGAASGSGKGKSTKPLTVGWADISGNSGGVAAGVRYFWEMFPSAVSVHAQDPQKTGRLVVHFLAAQEKPFEIISGMARTHEVLLVPHAAPRADLPAVFAAHQRPLRPFPSPEWLCASGVFGSIAPVTADYGPHKKDVETWDATMDGQYRKLMSERDLWQKRGVTMDAYGYLAFGDTLHWVWQEEPPNSPWAIAWDSNYYDKPLMMALFWARSGQPELFDFFETSSQHLEDIGVIHFHQGFPLHAGSRRCPATNHVGFDPPEHRQAVGNFSFDHHKSESLFYRYYLTGDRWAQRVAMGQADWAFQAKDAATGRNFAHQMESLLAAWWHTGDKKWLERSRTHFLAFKNAFAGGWPDGDFTTGFITESLVKYYEATGDKEALDALTGFCDRLITTGYKFPNTAYAYGFLWHKTGQDKYLQAALANMNTGRPDHTGKDTPMHYRSTAYLTGLLAQGARKP